MNDWFVRESLGRARARACSHSFALNGNFMQIANTKLSHIRCGVTVNSGDQEKGNKNFSVAATLESVTFSIFFSSEIDVRD